MRALVLCCLTCLMVFQPRSAHSCEIALVLAMDVSGSVDAWEYRLQVDGLAAGLRDPEVRAALIRGQVALSVVQWSGLGQQVVSLPWRRMLSEAEVDRFAARVADMPRAFDHNKTAVGEAIAFAASQFDAVPDCRDRIIDVSGDGAENIGNTARVESRNAHRAGIVINGLAIEGLTTRVQITSFYRDFVRTPDGFVETAQTHLDFARAMRRKLLRELTLPSS